MRGQATSADAVLERLLAIAGLALLGVALSGIALRLLGQGCYLPRSFIGVGLFVVADLALAPAGLLLLLSSQVLRRRLAQPLALLPSLAVVVLVIAGIAGVVIGANRLTVPVLARHLEWGRYGMGPPVRLSDLSEVTRLTSLEFPRGSTLQESAYLGGLSPGLAAKIRIPRQEVEAFLGQITERESLSMQCRALRNSDGVLLVQGGWWDPDAVQRFVSGTMIVGGGPGFVKFLLDLSAPSAATVYLFWSG